MSDSTSRQRESDNVEEITMEGGTGRDGGEVGGWRVRQGGMRLAEE